MKYKLLALDLDGTLVSKSNSISKQSLKAISKYIELGGEVSIVTGRSINSAIAIANKIFNETNKKISFISALNGGIIFDYKKNEIIEENLISEEVINDIHLILNKTKKISIVYYTNEGIKNNQVFMSNFCQFFMWLFSIRGAKLKSSKIAKNLSSYKLNIISKFFYKDFSNKMDEILAKLSDKIELSKTTKLLSEITKKNIDKGYSIRMISKLSNINLENIVAIGDSNNDVPMFNEVGYSIAINDKRIKQDVVKYNEVLYMSTKKAVAYAIENIILNYE